MPLTDFRSIYLPYCLLQQPDGRYAILNREYKPLGFVTCEYIKYEDYPILAEFRGLTKKLLAKLSCDGSETVAQIFLYNDGSIPTDSAPNMSSYLEKLGLLAKLKIIEEKL